MYATLTWSCWQPQPHPSCNKSLRWQGICALPKFHYELNFIEFFWGAMKKYLHNVITHLWHWRRTWQRCWHLYSSVKSTYWSTACTGGWKLTNPVWGPLQVKQFGSHKSCRCCSRPLNCPSCEIYLTQFWCPKKRNIPTFNVSISTDGISCWK